MISLDDKFKRNFKIGVVVLGASYLAATCALEVAKEVIERVGQGKIDNFEYFRSLNDNPDTLPIRDTISPPIKYRI